MEHGTARQRRRVLRPLTGSAAALLVLAGCGILPTPATSRYHRGMLHLATGNGSCRQFGAGYADLVTKYIGGYDIEVDATGTPDENISRIDTDAMDLGLNHADTASDAALGQGAFTRPQRIVALARVFDNLVEVVVRSDLRARTVTDLRGRRIATGTLDSGTDVMAGRLLTAAGLDPDQDVTRVRTPLGDAVRDLRSGSVDALVLLTGTPAGEITNLLAGAPGQFALLPVGDLLKPLNSRYGGSYRAATIPRTAHNTPADVPTVGDPCLLLASPKVPAPLALKLTQVIFTHQAELATVRPEVATTTKATARATDPVPLHPGVRPFYGTG